MRVLLISTALRLRGKTSVLAAVLENEFRAAGAETDLLDLAETPLPQCDGAACYGDPAVKAATARLDVAQAVIFCVPIYNHQPNAAAKNFVELSNDGWHGQVVGCAANAGGERSYLAPLTLLNCLMVDHRCLIVPRFVYVTGADFGADGALLSPGEASTRLAALASDVLKLAPAWSPA